jgi:hypothetical protein
MLLRAVTDKLAKFEDHGICDPVIDIEPFAPAADQASLTECPEVLGNVGLASIESGHDLMDGLFPRLQGLQDTQTHGLAQQAKALRRQLRHLSVDRKINHADTI